MKFACRKRIWSAFTPAGKPALASFSACSIEPREPHRVDARLLLDRDDDRWRAHVPCVPALQARGEIHVSDLLHQDGPAIHIRNDEIAQSLKARGAADVADEELARILVRESAAVLAPN